MGRVKTDSCLWVLCCCGGLPIIGLIKGFILVVPVTILVFFGCTGIAIILTPLVLWGCYRALVLTPKYGPNIKIFTFLLVWVPIFAYPPLVALVSLFIGLCIGLFGPVVATFDNQLHVLGGWLIVFEWSNEVIKELWDRQYNKMLNRFLWDFHLETLSEGEEQWDIRIIDLLVGLVIAFIGAVFDGLAIFVVATIWLIPCMLKTFYWVFRLYVESEWIWMLMLFIPYLIAFVLVPVGCVLAYGVACISGVVAGAGSAIVAYNDGIPKAFEWMWELIVKSWKQGASYVKLK